MTDPVDILQIDAAVRNADLDGNGAINASEYNRLCRRHDIASIMVANAIEQRLSEDGNNRDYNFDGAGMPLDYVYAIVEDGYNHSAFPRPYTPPGRDRHHNDQPRQHGRY